MKQLLHCSIEEKVNRIYNWILSCYCNPLSILVTILRRLGLPAKFPVDKSTYVYGPKDRPLKISWNLGVWDDANLKWIVRLDRLRKQASVIKSSKRLYQFSTIEYNHADFVTKKRIAYHVRDTLIYRYNYTINFYVPPSDLIDGAAYRVTIVQGYNKYLMQTIKKVFRVRVERKKEKGEMIILQFTFKNLRISLTSHS